MLHLKRSRVTNVRLLSSIVRVVLRLTHLILPRLIKLYRYKGLILYIPKGVFNPTYTLSAALIIKNISKVISKFDVVVDLGCGSGVLAIYTSVIVKPRVTYAFDINPKALSATKINAKINSVKNIIVLHTINDLLSVKADTIITNPPYLPLRPIDPLDLNWACGEHLECLDKILRIACSIVKAKGAIYLTVSSLSITNDFLRILRKYRATVSLVDYRVVIPDVIYLLRLRC